MACLTPVLRTKLDRCRQVAQRIIRIALKTIGGSKSVMNIFLARLHFVGLAEVLECPFEITAVERRNSMCVARFRRLGSAFLLPLAFAEMQVNSRPISDLPNRALGDLPKERGRFSVILLLKKPDRGFEIFQRGLMLRPCLSYSGLGNCISANLGPCRG